MDEFTTPIVGEKDYFDMDYMLKPIWLGLVWLALAVFPAIMYAAAQPWVDWISPLEWHAWRLIRIATGVEFGLLLLLWLLAYIKKPDFQRIYYRAIAWVIPFSWLFGFIAGWLFLFGGDQHWKYNGLDVMYWLFYCAILLGLEFLGYWLIRSGAKKYYRWEEQSWWNFKQTNEYNDTWPKQLGNFVDY